MKITLEGEPKEIAALLVETVKRRKVDVEDIEKNLHGLLKKSVESYDTHLNQAEQILSGGEIDPFRLPVVAALSMSDVVAMQRAYFEKENRQSTDHKTPNNRS